MAEQPRGEWRVRASAIVDVVSAMVLVAWVGGHAALGAFGARIAFAELARPDAARTMTRVFHEFDRLILAGIFVLAACAVVGIWLRGATVISQLRFGIELGLCALGLFEIFHVHALIEGMFAAGRTLEPAFQAVHRLSERCVHGEVLLVLGCFMTRAWPGNRASS